MTAVLVVLAATLPMFLSPNRLAAFELMRVHNDPCIREDQHLFWRDRAVGVNTGLLDPPFRDLAEQARARWNESARGFTFRGGGGGFCREDGVATLAFSDASCTGEEFGDADLLAITRSRWLMDEWPGELVDADVVFNEESGILRDEDAFVEVAMHELGHVLGLDHSDACGDSGAGTLMKSFLGTRRLEAPQADDVAGADFIYPPGSGTGTVPEGANSCVMTSQSVAGWPALPYLCIIPLLALRAWFYRRWANSD